MSTSTRQPPATIGAKTKIWMGRRGNSETRMVTVTSVNPDGSFTGTYRAKGEDVTSTFVPEEMV